MIQDKNNPKRWIADEGKTFMRKIDNEYMGEEILLGIFIDGAESTIDNYYEVDAESVAFTINEE
jgi:hypothetical protein